MIPNVVVYLNMVYGLLEQEGGRPAKKFENAEFQALLDEDDGQTQEHHAEKFNVDQTTVSRRFKAMDKIIKVGRGVPHKLTDCQQENQKIVCEMLLARYKRKSYLHRIVTGDEKWIYFENPNRNRSYVDPRKPTKSTARLNHLDRRTMLCIFWDQEGLIYYMSFSNPFTCRNCGGGDRGRVAIYRPFGEVSLSLNRTVTCMVLKVNDRRTSCPCHDEFRGPRSDYVRQAVANRSNHILIFFLQAGGGYIVYPHALIKAKMHKNQYRWQYLKSFYMWIEDLSIVHIKEKNDLQMFTLPPLERGKTEGDLYKRCSVCNTRKDAHRSGCVDLANYHCAFKQMVPLALKGSTVNSPSIL
ncbi:mariner Mos1 transposase [Trichonephila clavipes]|nr:mariner Mos1 transposase [Trichonephila clavipes]